MEYLSQRMYVNVGQNQHRIICGLVNIPAPILQRFIDLYFTFLIPNIKIHKYESIKNIIFMKVLYVYKKQATFSFCKFPKQHCSSYILRQFSETNIEKFQLYVYAFHYVFEKYKKYILHFSLNYVKIYVHSP